MKNGDRIPAEGHRKLCPLTGRSPFLIHIRNEKCLNRNMKAQTFSASRAIRLRTRAPTVMARSSKTVEPLWSGP